GPARCKAQARLEASRACDLGSHAATTLPGLDGPFSGAAWSGGGGVGMPREDRLRASLVFEPPARLEEERRVLVGALASTHAALEQRADLLPVGGDGRGLRALPVLSRLRDRPRFSGGALDVLGRDAVFRGGPGRRRHDGARRLVAGGCAGPVRDL